MSDENEMNRRAFLMATATAAAVVALPVLNQTAAAEATSAPANSDQYDVGPLSRYNADKVAATWAAKNKGAFFVIRRQGKLYASSSVCTHRRCILTAKTEEFYCHCHESEFSLEGTVTGGPAKRSLERYAISTNADKHVIVDKSKSFSEAHWDDPASFISVG